MIPMMAGGAFCRTNIPWQERTNDDEKDDTDDHSSASADSSLCPSGDHSPAVDDPNNPDNGKTRNGGRFPRSSTMAGVAKARRASRSAVEVIELKCENNTEAALVDLLGIRVSGSRSAGAFVQSVHVGSVADLSGRIEVGDQLLSVGSISLIGMTPDQVVRVLRAGFSYSSSSVRITVAHQWADKTERTLRPPSSDGHRAWISSSKSEGALSETSESTSTSTAIAASKLESVRLLSPPPRTSMPHAQLPGVLSSTAPVEVHQSSDRAIPRPMSRPHTQGAAKLRRTPPSLSIDQTTTTTIMDNDEKATGSCDHEDDNSLAITTTPSSISPAGSTSRFDSVLDMYESHSSEKLDTVPTLPPRPVTARRKSSRDRAKRKSSLQFLMVGNGGRPNFGISGAQSIDRQMPPVLPSTTIRATTLRHRRVGQKSEVDPTGSGKTTDCDVSKATAVTELSRRFSPKHISGQLRAWGSNESLHLPVLEEEDRFNVGKPPRSLHAEDIKHFISNAQRKSMRSIKERPTNEELPLVSFDQLNQTSPSPTEPNRRTIQSGSSGQSKSSKGSMSSQGSQKLSWQCPVCLDGASRIRRTKRRMMSTSCGHVFCSSCVEDVVGKYHMCPTCRMGIQSMKDVHPIFM